MSLFGTPAMAAGYAAFRPPLHPLILRKAIAHLGVRERLPRGLDVGCGSGASTRALAGLVSDCVGVDPVAPMLQLASAAVHEANFVLGRAEQLPIASRAVDLVTAAGSLNYTEPRRALAEVRRVLKAEGAFIVYDFSAGRRFADSTALDLWFLEFSRRYPPPPDKALRLNPESLAKLARDLLQPDGAEVFEIGLTLDREFYREYMMTETNVAYAVESGAEESAIRDWIRESLAAVFPAASREVLFDGYIAYFQRELL